MNPELPDLIARYLAGDLDESGRARLLAICRDDAEARRELARQTITERALGWLHTSQPMEAFTSEVLAQVKTESPTGSQFVHGVVERLEPAGPMIHLRALLWRWLAPLTAVAALLMVVFWLHDHAAHETAAGVQGEELVARLTGAQECQWKNEPATFPVGSHLRRGQRLELVKGFVEITFDCGARVVLEGPASCDLDSAWDVTLNSGILKATVPPQAMGFRVTNPAVQVTDLGTEFAMIAKPGGVAEVSVLKGKVEAVPAGRGASEAMVLQEKKGRRFSASGVSELSDGEQAFARFAQPVNLERETGTAHYIHWSFDEAAGNLVKADADGSTSETYAAQLEAMPPDAHIDGRWQRALSFDGAMLARANFPGISTNAPRTVLFWVKVPEAAALSDAYAMVAWRANGQKLGSRAVHICWNRNPTEGAIGALRTDFARGFAVGSTPLRDGQWHHIAVVFVPGERAEDPVQVKQYIDGRLEGSARKSPKRSDALAVLTDQSTTSVSDVLWLGCRLGSNGPRKERFHGALDELFVADRALTPQEIVQIMMENHPLDPSRAHN